MTDHTTEPVENINAASAQLLIPTQTPPSSFLPPLQRPIQCGFARESGGEELVESLDVDRLVLDPVVTVKKSRDVASGVHVSLHPQTPNFLNPPPPTQVVLDMAGAVKKLVVLDVAGAVKEIVENNLDAGATSVEVRFKDLVQLMHRLDAGAAGVEVRLKDFGAELIEVADNGCRVLPPNWQFPGQSPIPYSLYTVAGIDSRVPHSLSSFGFRGEALSSLCALAHVTITTRIANEPIATLLAFDHVGKLLDTPRGRVARAVRTTVSVAKIFSTLPVRRREFERNVRGEFAKLSSAHTTMVHTGRTGSMRENTIGVFGANAAAGLDLVDITFPLSLAAAATAPLAPASPSPPAATVTAAATALVPPTSCCKVAGADAYDVNVTPDKRKVFLHYEVALLSGLRATLSEFSSLDRYVYRAAPASSVAKEIEERARREVGEKRIGRRGVGRGVGDGEDGGEGGEDGEEEGEGRRKRVRVSSDSGGGAAAGARGGGKIGDADADGRGAKGDQFNMNGDGDGDGQMEEVAESGEEEEGEGDRKKTLHQFERQEEGGKAALGAAVGEAAQEEAVVGAARGKRAAERAAGGGAGTLQWNESKAAAMRRLLIMSPQGKDKAKGKGMCLEGGKELEGKVVEIEEDEREENAKENKREDDEREEDEDSNELREVEQEDGEAREKREGKRGVGGCSKGEKQRSFAAVSVVDGASNAAQNSGERTIQHGKGEGKEAALEAAAKELERRFDKRDFASMAVIGQLNLRFIIGRLGSDLFIAATARASENGASMSGVSMSGANVDGRKPQWVSI
ncbi:unnamed protein product [Closterium sp. NIES-64]|nr:unnamed protein product [Closterium sp. NIES-64]